MRDLHFFDIGQTLVNATNAHLVAYKKAYSLVFCIDLSNDIMLRQFGKAEIEAHITVCQELGILYEDSQLERIIQLWDENVSKTIASEGVKALPGARECLEYASKNNLLLGVVTGNSRKVGEALLKAGHLMEYFPIKSYGDGAQRRVEILEQGVQQAKELGYEGKGLTVIGDSPSDIEAGKAVHAFNVSVTTGYYDRKRLESAGADLVLDSLLEYRTIFDREG